jgi:hypothetical protein
LFFDILIFCVFKIFFHRRLIEWSQDHLQDLIKRVIQIEMLFGNYNNEKGRDGNPDLCFHGIFTVAPERLDLQVLFDPLKKVSMPQWDLLSKATMTVESLKLLVRKTNVFLVSES